MPKTRKGRERSCEQGIQSPALQIALVFFQWLYNAETILEGIIAWCLYFIWETIQPMETHPYTMDKIEHHFSRWSFTVKLLY